MPENSNSNKPKSNQEPGLIAGRFEVLEEIGSGGVSTVFKARDLVLSRLLAIKLLKPEKMREDHLVRLQKEAKAICQLDHPNIIGVFDFLVTEDNIPLLAMEYVEGISLKELVERDGPIPVEQALKIFRQICNALSFAHKRNILHRDLKPGNVLLSKKEGERKVKIIDFGIAKSLDIETASMTTSGNIVGTPAYMSPEQARGDSLDFRSDIYALGCLMFKVLTGSSPFSGNSFVEIMDKQVNQKCPKLIEVNSKLEYGDAVQDIVGKALQKKTDQRFQSMDEMKEAIDSVLNRPSTISIEESEFGSSSNSNFLKYLIFGMILLLILVPIGFGIFMLFQKDSQEVAQEISDTTFAIRQEHGIGQKYVKGREWFTLSGEITDEKLDALSKISVKRLAMSNSKFENSSLGKLKNLPIIILDVRNSNISDRGIELVSKMDSIRSLIISNCPNLTSAGYEHIGNMKNLEILDLRNSTVADQDLKALSGLKKLLVLYLSNCKNITDQSAPTICSLPKLLSIRLGSTAMTKAGINKLKAKHGLIFIGLNGSDLSFSNMPDFSQNIAMLDLSNSNIEDRCLARIYALKKLWYLDVQNCKNISMVQHNRLLNTFLLSEGKAVVSDHTPKLPDSEWYLDPENYETKLGESVALRKKLIRAILHGDPKI